jgi:methylated-DNA-[protein]-cysteine S-methyltransferase
MRVIATQYFDTPFGELIMGSFEDKLCLCDWRYRKMRKAVDDRLLAGLQASFVVEDSPVLGQARQGLQAYWEGKQTAFETPLLLVGTDFQKSVWNELLKIPFGKTETYLRLSHILENPKAIRAIASANGANAISIFVPCHRIIGSNGELIGYAGGLDAKRRLLLLENKNFEKQAGLFE